MSIMLFKETRINEGIKKLNDALLDLSIAITSIDNACRLIEESGISMVTHHSQIIKFYAEDIQYNRGRIMGTLSTLIHDDWNENHPSVEKNNA